MNKARGLFLFRVSGTILPILYKVMSSSLVITLIAYSANIYGLRVLDKDIMGKIVFFQSFLIIGLQICSAGYNYEILRYGNTDKYRNGVFGIQLKGLILNILLCIVYIISCAIILDAIQGPLLISTLIVLQFFAVLIFLGAAALRSLGSYVLSNFLDKFIVTSTATAIVVATFLKVDILELAWLYMAIFLVVLGLCLFVLNKRIGIKTLMGGENLEVERGIRNNLYAGSILMLVVLEAQNMFIAEKISFSQLSLWNTYLLLFFPFKFIARNVHQVLFSELANDRYSLNKRALWKYLFMCMGLGLVVYIIGVFPYKMFYAGIYEIENTNVFLVALMGVFHMIYSPIGVYLGSKMTKHVLTVNNIWALLLSILLVITYYYFLEVHFPQLLLMALTSYWLAKSMFGYWLIRHNSRVA